MTFLKELARRLRFLLHPTRFNSGLATELQFHIDTRAYELEAAQRHRPRRIHLRNRRPLNRQPGNHHRPRPPRPPLDPMIALRYE